MGRYSSADSEEERRKSRKKKKIRSRSVSSDDSYSSKRSKKSKKTKKDRRRSRSRSSEYRKRSRSRSRRKSRDRRSRSSSYSSRYKSRRSRSRSRRRSRSRSRSYDSRSRRRRSSRSRSKTKKSSRSSSVSKDNKRSVAREDKDPCHSIPGFEDMSLVKQNEIRMKMALKAAAETDARLREQGVLLPTATTAVDYADEEKRSRAIAEIDNDGFTPHTFTSSKNQRATQEDSTDRIHESAMFGDSELLSKPSSKSILYKNTDSILAPVFYEDPDVKWKRWVEHVKLYRHKKLEGVEMTS